MVYTPRPNFVKRILDEFTGFIVFVFISRLVVATTGGSTAFATNLLVNAFANGAGYAVAIAIWPHVFLDLTLLICKFFDDLLLWFVGGQGLVILDFILYLLLALAQFIGGLIAYLFIWVFIDRTATNLGLPDVPTGVDAGRAVGGEAILAIFFVFGFFFVSQVYNRLFIQGRTEAGQMDTIVDANSKKRVFYVVPGYLEGSDKYVLGAFTRAIVLGLLRFGLAAGGIPITGGLFNVFGYLDGAIVSWTWHDSYYVQTFGPLAGIFGYFFYVAFYYLPMFNLYEIFFVGDRPNPLSTTPASGTQKTMGPGPLLLKKSPNPDFYHHRPGGMSVAMERRKRGM